MRCHSVTACKNLESLCPECDCLRICSRNKPGILLLAVYGVVVGIICGIHLVKLFNNKSLRSNLDVCVCTSENCNKLLFISGAYDTGVVYIVVLMRIRTARLRLCFAAFCKNLFHRSYFASASACTIAAGHAAPSPGGT